MGMKAKLFTLICEHDVKASVYSSSLKADRLVTLDAYLSPTRLVLPWGFGLAFGPVTC